MNEEVAAQIDENRFEILTLAHKRQCEAIDYHNDLAFKIFSWSTTWLLAIAGYILSQSAQLDIQGCVFLITVVIGLFAVSFWWQHTNKLQIRDHAENLTRLNEIFHLREPGYFDMEPIYGKELHTHAPAWGVHLAYHLALMIATITNLGVLLLKLKGVIK
jgi:hypothetical protein